jgi:hypothetical protein
MGPERAVHQKIDVPAQKIRDLVFDVDHIEEREPA